MITKSVHRTFRFTFRFFSLSVFVDIRLLAQATALITAFQQYQVQHGYLELRNHSAPCPHNQSCAYSPQVRLFPMRAVLYILKHHTARRCLIFEFAHSFLLLPASQTVNYTAIVNVITGAYATPMRGNNPSAHGSMWCVLFSSQGAKRNFAFGSYARIKPAHIAICSSIPSCQCLKVPRGHLRRCYYSHLATGLNSSGSPC